MPDSSLRSMTDTAMESPEVLMARFEELSILESEFEDAEAELSMESTVSPRNSQCLTVYSPQSRGPPCAPLQKARRVHHQDPTLLVTRL